jgi:hypothetical protein
VAAASEFGLDGNSQFKPAGFKRKNSVADNAGAPTSQADVDIALALANAAAAGQQTIATSNDKESADPLVENRRLRAQVEALQQHKVALRSQLNHLRQASAAGVLDGTGEPK